MIYYFWNEGNMETFCSYWCFSSPTDQFGCLSFTKSRWWRSVNTVSLKVKHDIFEVTYLRFTPVLGYFEFFLVHFVFVMVAGAISSGWWLLVWSASLVVCTTLVTLWWLVVCLGYLALAATAFVFYSAKVIALPGLGDFLGIVPSKPSDLVPFDPKHLNYMLLFEGIFCAATGASDSQLATTSRVECCFHHQCVHQRLLCGE